MESNRIIIMVVEVWDTKMVTAMKMDLTHLVTSLGSRRPELNKMRLTGEYR